MALSVLWGSSPCVCRWASRRCCWWRLVVGLNQKRQRTSSRIQTGPSSQSNPQLYHWFHLHRRMLWRTQLQLFPWWSARQRTNLREALFAYTILRICAVRRVVAGSRRRSVPWGCRIQRPTNTWAQACNHYPHAWSCCPNWCIPQHSAWRKQCIKWNWNCW